MSTATVRVEDLDPMACTDCCLSEGNAHNDQCEDTRDPTDPPAGLSTAFLNSTESVDRGDSDSCKLSDILQSFEGVAESYSDMRPWD